MYCCDLGQRRWNTVIASLHVFILGFEFQAILVSLLYYLQNEVSVDSPHLYYGVITASSCLSSVFSGVIFGGFVDRTRNVKLVILFNALLSIVGNVMYTVPYSVWFLIIGRFFNGFTESIQPVMCGKVKPYTLYMTFYDSRSAISLEVRYFGING